MRKLVMVISLLAFVAAAPMAMAAEKPSKAEKVACCHGKGKCDNKHTKTVCEKEGGKVVMDCKDCK
jgi:hypothetical protein